MSWRRTRKGVVPVGERVNIDFGDGRAITVRSNLEAGVARRLDSQGVEFRYESSKLPYTVTKSYTPDFELIKRDGRTMYVEVKGYFSPEDRSKTRAILTQYPQLDLRFVFGNANTKISKKSMTTYAQWCDKLSIPWAEREVPLAWIHE